MDLPPIASATQGIGVTRVITPHQFARVLDFLGFGLSEVDCRRLCHKFAEPKTGMVSYAAFCQAVDCWFTAQAPVDQSEMSLQTPEEKSQPPVIGDSNAGKKITNHDRFSVTEPKIFSCGDDLPVQELINRIRHLVLIHRIPLKPWFHDFDQLRSGKMTRSRFERCLTAAGLTRLDLHDLTPTQMEKLLQHYTSEPNNDLVDWKRFIEDIDSGKVFPL